MERLAQPKKPFALVRWFDAWTTLHQKMDEDDIDPTPMELHTYGWLIKDTVAGITIAAEWYPADRGWRAISFIPRPYLIELVVLNTPQRKRNAKRQQESKAGTEADRPGGHLDQPE